MIFQVGDKVKIVDEQSEGTVVRIERGQVWVATNIGFDFPYLPHQIIKISETGERIFSPKDFQQPDELLHNFDGNIRWSYPKVHLHTKSVPEIDLHIEEISNFPLLPHEHLIYQLGFFKLVMDQAKTQKVRRLIFIHGIGKGVLRSSMQKVLEECYPEAECVDGSYSKFGYGAMEIVLRNLFH